MPAVAISQPTSHSDSEDRVAAAAEPSDLSVVTDGIPDWMSRIDGDDPVRAYLRGLPLHTQIGKRVLDIVVASLLLIPAIPVMAMAALAIKLTSKGPILFKQVRVGLNARRRDPVVAVPHSICRRQAFNFGRPFVIFKLRTMHVDSDTEGPSTATAGDARVFPIGRFLRKSRIDELPQLWNVLRGEMSMVGPRPECIDYMDRLCEEIPNYVERLGLKPGLTGVAQIEAGYANDLKSYRRKVAFDLIYLQNCCVVNDLKIMVRTARVMLTGFGAL